MRLVIETELDLREDIAEEYFGDIQHTFRNAVDKEAADLFARRPWVLRVSKSISYTKEEE